MHADVLECCATATFSGNGVVVYRLDRRAAWGVAETNLLRNGGFEARDAAGRIEVWGVSGQPRIAERGTAHSGDVAVLVTPTDVLVQPVSVEGGRLYRLSHVTRAEQPQQYARLQINWLDPRGQMVDVSIEVVPASSRWTKHALMVTAPERAATALVYASVHGNSRVWFDDFALVRGE
jgi:hypothetical protein